jgi:hypothetical protein
MMKQACHMDMPVLIWQTDVLPQLVEEWAYVRPADKISSKT